MRNAAARARLDIGALAALLGALRPPAGRIFESRIYSHAAL
jgi:hypothetical protein